MADSDSEIDFAQSDNSDTDANEADDQQLHDEIIDAMNAEPEVENIIPADIDPASLNADEEGDEDITAIDDVKVSAHDEPHVEEAPTGEKIQIHELGRAEDSRQSDIPSRFELAGLIISRATMLEQNSQPMIPFTRFDPYAIARGELLSGKSIRCVLRGDYVWKVSDFAYFPVDFANIDAEVDAHHTIQ